MTSSSENDKHAQAQPEQKPQQTTPPPRPDTSAHQPNVTYVTKSYKGDPNRPLVQRDAE